MTKSERELFQMKQGEDSVRIFATKIRTAAADLLEKKRGEKIVKRIFMNGLKSVIALEVEKKDPRNLEEAIKIAMKAEES